MKSLKQIFLFFFGGATMGVTIGSVLAPKFVQIGTGNQGALCNCRELAADVASVYLEFQLGGVIIGGFAGFMLWAVLRRKGKLG